MGGIVEGILGIFAKYWVKFISPIVSGCVVIAIGFSLLSVGASTFGGGTGSQDFGSVENWIIASVTLLSCILFQIFAKSCYKNLSVLVGMIVGYILAIILGKVDFSNLYLTLFPLGQKYDSLDAAAAAGAVTINYGLFINTVISFLIVACAIFAIIKFVNALRKTENTEVAVAEKECPYCCTQIPINAKRCPNCTSELQ